MKPDYHNIRAVSRGLIVDLTQRTAAHAWLNSAWNTNYTEPEPTAAMELGTAAHALILEGRDITASIYNADFRTKAAQEARDTARAAGLVPILRDKLPEFLELTSMAKAQIEAALSVSLEHDGKAEQPILWDIPGMSGLQGKCKPDWQSNEKRLTLDLKITDLSQAAFLRGIAANGYDIQAAWYQRGTRAAFEVDTRFVFAIVENTAPIYPVYFVELDPAWLAIANAKIDLAVKKWRACLDAKHFPAYPQAVIRAEPPAWELAAAEELDAQDHAFSAEAFLFGKVRNENL